MYMNILYITIFLVICLFVYSTWTRKKIYKEVDRLDDWKMELTNRPITDEISKVKGLKMSGETEEKFENWRAIWEGILSVKLPDLEEDLFDVEEYANKYRFNKAKRLIKEIETKIQGIEEELKQLLEDVNSLVGSEEKNRTEISEIRKFYYDVKKFFSVHRGSFGKGASILEERLEKVHEKFPMFEQATEEGNYLEARELLEGIKIETDTIHENMKEIPKLLVQFQSHIPNDLNELRQGLKEMEEEGYAIEHFTFEKDIQRLEAESEAAIIKIDMLELESSADRLKEINEQIDQIYDALEVEAMSKAKVLETIKSLNSRIHQTDEHLEELYSETEQVQQSYRITEEELKYQQLLSKKLKDIIQKVSIIDDITEHKKQSYTSINEMLVELNVEYNELEENIKTAVEKLSALRRDELKASETLQDLKTKIIEAKRSVQKSNIPGLPKAILDDIIFSEKKLMEAMELLGEIPLEMNSVTKKVEEAVAHVESTVNEIEKTIELAGLAELIIQYGNRYRSQSYEVNEQLNEAEAAFRSYHYEEAIELAEDAVSVFEPNVRERLNQVVSS